MSKTHQFNISAALTLVSSTHSVDAVTVARAALKASLTTEAGKVKYAESRGQQRFIADLFSSDKSDEEVIIQILRAGLRDVIREALTEASDSDQRIKVGDVKVTLKASESSALARSCDCNACYECKIARGGAE